METLHHTAGGAKMHRPWLILCTVLLSLFLAFCKRRQELEMLVKDASYHRASLRE